MPIKLLSVDLQKDFSAPGGKHYRLHPNVAFIADTLIPFLREHNVKLAEIVSDYRQPRPGDLDDSCNPGTIGYESEITDDLKESTVWVKCMNSPIWTRENAGNPDKTAGLPYEDTAGFGEWLEQAVGKPAETEVVLIGLTIDCCVLCTAQELTMRGYQVSVLEEGVDPYSGNQVEKETILNGPILRNWAKVVGWSDLETRLKG